MSRHSVFAITLMVVLSLLLVFTVHIKSDISGFFFQGDSPETALVASSIQSGDLSKQYLLLLEAPNKDVDIISFSEELQYVLEQIDGIEQVWPMDGGTDFAEKVSQHYTAYVTALFSLNPERDIPAIFRENALQSRANNIKKALMSQEFSGLQKSLLDDPLLLLADWSKHLGQSTNKETNELWQGLTVKTKASGLDSAAQILLLQKIQVAFKQVNADFSNVFNLRMTGVPIFAMQVQKQVSQDVSKVSLISIITMIMLFLFTFRSLRGLLWIGFVLSSSIALASIITSWGFGYLHGLTIAIGSTLIGVCIDYPIHSMVHAATVEKKQSDCLASTRQIWPSLLLGGLTTVVGYVALSLTSHPGMQQLALFAGVGIAAALILTRFVLPGLMQSHISQVSVRLNFSSWLVWVTTYKKQMFILISMASVLSLFLIVPKLQWTDDLSQLSPALEELRHEDQSIRQQMSSIEAGRFIMVEGSSVEQVLQLNEHVFQTLSELKEEGSITSFYSLYPWMASEELQQRNQQAFAQEFIAEHEKLWQESLEKEKLSVGKLGHFSAYQPKTLSWNNFQNMPFQNVFHGMYVQSEQGVLLMSWLGLHDVEKVKAKLSGLQGVRYISQKDIVNNLAKRYREQTVSMLGLGLLAIFMLLLFRFRHVITTVKVLLPAGLSVLFVLSIWGLIGREVGMLHLIGLLLVVAICVDYAIFIFENRAQDMGRTFQAILISALTTFVAFFSLGFAENPALQAMAWTVAPGVIFGFLFCPLLLQSSDNSMRERSIE